MPSVVIMGAGPAGLTLGCHLARAGVDHVILERGHHPRPRVGETLLPSALEVFDEIGFLGIVREAGFRRADGIVYHTLDDAPVVVGYGEFPGDPPRFDHSFHADRARLDMLLLKHAESLGCRIVQGASARHASTDDGGRVTGVVATIGTETLTLDADLVVDATGHRTLLGGQFDLRVRDPELDQVAFHSWFSDVDVGPGDTAGHVHIFFLPVHRGWAWCAPLTGGYTSVGLVTDRESFQQWNLGPEEFFGACVAEHPRLRSALASAHMARTLQAETSVNYGLERVCGDGWLAVGDAARFVDPVFSSGVGVAVASARSAARHVVQAMGADGPTARALRPYQDELFGQAAVWRRFVRLYYRLMPAFTVFVQSPRHRPGILGLLQGDVRGAVDSGLLDEMDALVREVESRETHPLRPALRESRP